MKTTSANLIEAPKQWIAAQGARKDAMQDDVSLDGVVMFVSSTAHNGVVDASTRIAFSQRGSKVLGKYRGGRIRRGCLVGKLSLAALTFRYVQVEISGEIHAGRSACDVTRTPGGGLRIIERFSWTTRDGSGINVFDELRA
jgi:hypothetical protein